MNIKYKNSGLQLKDLDSENMKVKVAISKVGYKDSDGDIITMNAFNKTLMERGPSGSKRIVHLMQHDTRKVVGKPLEFGWEQDTLYAVSAISNSQMGKDLLEDYKLELYEHSIGFEVMQENYDSSKEANVISELKLWEYSSVTWGANDQTPFMGFVKSLSKEDKVEQVNDRMGKLQKAISKGNYSDERGQMIEYELKQIQDLYNSLIEDKPNDNIHLESDEPNSRELIEILTSNFKN